MTGNRSAEAPPDQKIRDQESSRVHEWRVSRLTDLGLAPPAAEAVADRIDWHDVAHLVARGCPPALAVAILN